MKVESDYNLYNQNEIKTSAAAHTPTPAPHPTPTHMNAFSDCGQAGI